MRDYKKLSASPDCQGQYYDPKAWKIHLQVIKDFKPDIHIVIGDFMECESVSMHAKENSRPMTLGEEYAFGRELRSELDVALPKNCKKIMLGGNHERRVESYINNQAPQLEGALRTVPEGLDLKQNGWKWISQDEQPIHFGHASFAHGWFTNEHHSKKHVQHMGANIFYGHTHAFQAFSVTQGNQPKIGMSIGSLALRRRKWRNGCPVAWSHGMLLMYLLEGGNFIHQFLPIIDGKTVFNGKLYSA